MTRYEELAARIEAQVQAGTLRAGDRIPSVREACAAQRVSAGTVQSAYRLLEDRGLIQTRPRSGCYVSATWKAAKQEAPIEPATSRPPRSSTPVDVSELVFEILESVKSESVVPLGSAFIHPSLFPLPKLARFMGTATRLLKPQRMVADLPPGNPELRRAIARRYLGAGVSVDPEDILITHGGMEALNLSLQAVARPGDTIAIEGPAFYAALQAIERLGMKALALPTHPREGVDLEALASALQRRKIAACWFMTSFSNPLGSLMAEDKRRALVEMLAAHEVPLIVDDVYEELYFGKSRPRPAKAWDEAGLVLHCSSFSKCLAPGYRVGWVLGGRYARQVRRLKMMTTLSTAIPPQAALADYLKQGGYDHHLRALRAALKAQQARMIEAVTRHFPAGTRMTRPQGGYFLWVEMPAGIDALELHRRAAQKNISVAPGPIFSPQRHYANCLRINYGQPFTPQIEAAVATLGRIAHTLA